MLSGCKHTSMGMSDFFDLNQFQNKILLKIKSYNVEQWKVGRLCWLFNGVMI